MNCANFAASFAVVLALAAASASAQDRDHVAIYLTSTSVHATNAARGTVDGNTYYITSPGSQDTQPEQYQSLWNSAVGLGVTVAVADIGRTSLGVDIRYANAGATPSLGSVMGGLRLAYRPPRSHFKPYAVGSYGVSNVTTVNADPVYVQLGSCFLCSSEVTGPSTYKRGYKGFQVAGGVDLPILPDLDLRIAEFGFGHSTPLGDTAYVTRGIDTISISTGLVLHF